MVGVEQAGRLIPFLLENRGGTAGLLDEIGVLLPWPLALPQQDDQRSALAHGRHRPRLAWGVDRYFTGCAAAAIASI